MFPFVYVENSMSTNDEIQDFITGESKALSLYTFNQTKGRGQYGNQWETPPGTSLAFSFALKCSASPISGHLFNYHTAVTVRDFIANLTNQMVFIKWPNDLILNGKKICGMLTEKKKTTGEDYYIIGIGINILQADFQELPKAGSLLTQTGKVYDLNEVALGLHQYLSTYLVDGKAEFVMEKFNEHLFRKDEISVFEIEGVRQNGIIRKADEEGFLWVEFELDGLRKFYHKEIQMLY